MVWAADYTPFGKATVTTQQITLNLRFPGQYEDQESGTHYNYFRDYNPETGRYLTSDPIGLKGGMNLFAYVGVNPLSGIDPLGLQEAGPFGFADTDQRPPVPQSLPQGVVDYSAGLGDTLLLGFGDELRDLAGVDGGVNQCSRAYSAGVGTGVAAGLVGGGAGVYRGFQRGRELSIGSNFRIAPFGNRTGHPTGRFPHYHRRGVDPETGQTRPGQGIGRHRPLDTRSTDSSFRDRF